MTADGLPLFDLARRWGEERDAVLAAIERVAARADFNLGEELARFEEELADACGTAHAVGVSSGTAAIELALRAVGAGPGTEVVTAAHTFVATVEAIAATGARPVLVDVDPATRVLDGAALGAVLGPRTAAVVPVHLYGRPAVMDGIVSAGVPVVEDVAQAQGAQVGERRTGALGTAGALSFYPTKTLGGMGDGGAVVTSDATVAETVRSLRHHGCAPDDGNDHRRRGTTARLDTLQAAILRLRLPRLDADIDARRQAASWYRERLQDLPLRLPAPDASGERQVFNLFVVESEERDALRGALDAAGIGSGVHYPTPIHLQPAWRDLGYGPGDLPVSERLAATVLSLPLFPGIREDEVDRVCAVLRAVLA